MAKKIAITYEVTTGKTAKELAEVEIRLGEISKALRQAKKDADGKTYAKLRAEQIDLQEQGRRLRQEVRDQSKAFKDAKFPADSLIGLRQEYKRLRKEVNALSTDQRNSDFGRNLIQQAAQVKQQIDDIGASVGDFRTNVGNYQNAIENALNATGGLLGGNFGSLVAGLGSGAAIAGIFEVVKDGVIEVDRLRDEFIELRRQVALSVDASEADLNSLTQTILALSKTFQVENLEIAKAIGQVQQQLSVDAPKSAELFEKSLLAVADQSDFIGRVNDELRQLADLDLPPDSALALVAEASNRNINIDVFAEPIIRLREALPSTVKALEDAFGREATKELFETFEERPLEAITKISEGLDQLPPRSKEAGQILADVFAASGEDAVATARSIGEISLSLDGLIDISDEYVQRQLRVLEANKFLSASQGFLATQMGQLGNETETTGIKLKGAFVGALADVTLRFRAFSKTIGNFLRGNFEVVSRFDLLAEDIKKQTEEEERQEEQIKQSNEAIKSKIDAISKLEKVTEQAAAGSLKFLESRVKTLKEELQGVTNAADFAKLSDELTAAEEKLRETQVKFRNATQLTTAILTTSETIGQPGGPQTSEGAIQAILDQLNLEQQARAEIEADTQQILNDIRKRGYDEYTRIRKENRDAQAEEERELWEQQQQIIGQTLEAIGVSLGGFFADTEQGFKELAKQLFTTFLTLIENEILATIALAQATEIGKKGFLGIATGAILAGVIKGLFAAVKSQIKGFAEGGVIDRGAPIQRSNGDNVLITAKKGEVILNKRQQAAAGGPDFFRRLRVPGFNTGGVIGSTPQIIQPSSPLVSQGAALGGSSIDQDTLEQLAEKIAAQTGAAVQAGIISAEQRRERRENLKKQDRQ